MLILGVIVADIVGAVIRFLTKIEGSDQVSSYGKSLDGLNGKILALGAAYVSIAGAQKAWDIAKQGAVINQTRESFERMNAEVFKTPDLLDQMKDASRGTIGEIDLMRGLLTLTAGTTDEMARSMADAAPKLLEIAKAANKLNPSLGDTAFLYESLTLGIKRNSPMIIDNTGLSLRLGAANDALAASLGKTVEQLTAAERTQGLINATMEAGGRLIQQVGGNVDSATDSYAQMEVAVKGAFSLFKSTVATEVAGQMTELAGSVDEAAASFDKLAISAAKGLAAVIGSGADAAQNFGGAAVRLFSTDEMAKQLGAADPAAAKRVYNESLGIFFDALTTDMTMLEAHQEVFKRYEKALSMATSNTDALANPSRGLARTFRDNTAAVEELTDASIEWSRWNYEEPRIAALRKTEEAVNQLRAAEREAAKERQTALLAWNQEVQAAGRQSVVGALSNLDSPDALVRPARTVSVATGPRPEPWKTDALERYQDALTDTGQDLFDLQSGFRMVGDSAEDQAEAIAKTHEEMRQIQGAISGLNVAATEYTQVQQEMTVNTDALNKMFFEQAVAGGGSVKTMLDIGLATGELNQEQYDALIIQDKLAERAKILNAQVDAGAISADAAVTGLQHYADQLVSTEDSAGGATDAVIAAKDAVVDFASLDPAPVKLTIDDSEVITKLQNATTSLQSFGNLSAGELAMQRALQGGGTNQLPAVPVELRPEFQSVTDALTTGIPESVEDVIIPLKPDSEEVDSKIFDLRNDTVFIPVVFVPQNDPVPPSGGGGGGGGRPDRALGGPVNRGQAYIVGDGGKPELFVPWTSGYVYPSVPSPSQNYGSPAAARSTSGGTSAAPVQQNITIVANGRESMALALAATDVGRKQHLNRIMGRGRS